MATCARTRSGDSPGAPKSPRPRGRVTLWVIFCGCSGLLGDGVVGICSQILGDDLRQQRPVRFSARAGDPKEAGGVHQKDCSTRGISWGFIGHRGPGLKHRDSPLCQLVTEMVPATSQVPAWEARTAVLVSRVSGTDVTVMLQGRSKRLASWTSCLMIISQENSKFPLRFQIETVKTNRLSRIHSLGTQLE